jgi:hypothetical protein
MRGIVRIFQSCQVVMTLRMSLDLWWNLGHDIVSSQLLYKCQCAHQSGKALEYSKNQEI